MSRVTSTEVKTIIDTNLSDYVIQVWIDGANTIVTDNCTNSSETNKAQIELYLSAHFIGMLDPSVRGFITKEKVDVFETTYSNPITLSNIIDSTPYGTTANMLSGGCLAATTGKATSFCSL